MPTDTMIDSFSFVSLDARNLPGDDCVGFPMKLLHMNVPKSYYTGLAVAIWQEAKNYVSGGQKGWDRRHSKELNRRKVKQIAHLKVVE